MRNYKNDVVDLVRNKVVPETKAKNTFSLTPNDATIPIDKHIPQSSSEKLLLAINGD